VLERDVRAQSGRRGRREPGPDARGLGRRGVVGHDEARVAEVQRAQARVGERRGVLVGDADDGRPRRGGGDGDGEQGERDEQTGAHRAEDAGRASDVHKKSPP